MNQIKIGIVQKYIHTASFGTSNRKKNMINIKTSINQLFAQEENIDMIVLPAEYYTGSSYNFTSLPEQLGKSKSISELSEIAKYRNCYITGGFACSIENNITDRRYRNVGFIISRDGEMMGFQERIHRFNIEKEFIIEGQGSRVFKLDFGKVGLVSGLDLMYPEIIQQRISEGTEILIASCLLAEGDPETEHYDLITKIIRQCVITRALENSVFMIYVNGLGKSNYEENGAYSGESIVTSPLGIIKEFSDQEEDQIVKINMEDLNTAKALIQIT